MHRFISHIWIQLTVLVILSALPISVFAQGGVTAVLSSDLGPYAKAYSGFVEAFGQSVTQINLKDDRFEVPADTRVVVAFGGKAALLDYPDDVTLIYCLAPGVSLAADQRLGRSVKVSMLPSAEVVLGRLKVVQPELRRLGVFWSSDAQAGYLRNLGVAAEGLGIRVQSVQVDGSEDLPDGLRDLLRQGTDGIWLPPDPRLINARSFLIFREFSRSNDVPLYVPTSSLLDRGAVASVSCGFDEIGRTAGRLAQMALSSGLPGGVVYPERVVFQVNEEAARDAGLEVDRDGLEAKGGQVQ